MSDPAPRVLLVKGVCNYDHLRAFTDYLRLGFLAEGASVRVLDLARGAPALPEWEALNAWGPSLVLSFNLDGAHLVGPGGEPLGAGRVPFTTWMVDEPYYQPHWAEVLRLPHVRAYWSNHETHAAAVAMGLPEPRRMDLAGRALPRVADADRSIDVLFAGSVCDPEAMRARWREQLGAGTSTLMGALIERWSGDASCSLGGLFDELTEQMGLADHPSLTKLRPLVLGEVNRHVRASRRLALVRALRDMPLVVVGDGWSELLEGGRVEVRPSVPFHLYEEMVSDARVTLAVQPIHAHGASERYFASLGNGSALVVNRNDWLDEAYGPGCYLGYDLFEPEQARAHLDALLSSPARRRELTEAARETTLDGHLWRHRARGFLRDAMARPTIAATGARARA